MLLFFGAFAGSESSAFPGTDPNIVIILCDDLGYGDVQCLNQNHGKIKTPNADQLAREGMVFKWKVNPYPYFSFMFSMLSMF